MTDFSRLHFAHFDVSLREDGSPWELGRGAMGVTYKARDPQLRMDVALKVINPAQVGDAKAKALFLREARAAARVHHANVGTVVYLNQDPENMFYAMEFIAGESLRDWLHSRVPLSPLMAVELSLQIARGLEAIHREGVIHRDLKPTNLMILRADKQRNESDPEAWLIKIIDFGLARNIAGEVSESAGDAVTTGFRGTALYASPEQCEERRDLDARSDLYSLGCVMWEMLVGTPPFRANVHRELLNAHVAKPPPLAQLSHLPAGLQTMVARLLLKDREARFADAGAVIRALEKCREQVVRGVGGALDARKDSIESVAATTDLPGTIPTALGPRRKRWRGVTAAALVAIGLLGGVVSWRAGWLGGLATNAERADMEHPVVAILPVDSIDGGKDESKFADALTGELINRASKLAATRVISRGAVTAYKTVPGGQPRKRIRAIDAELGGVTAVLETSVDRQGDALKINSILYDAKTEQRLWGDTYRREWREAAAAEREVPEQITRALRTRLAAAKRESPEQRAAPGPTAADLYFQAMAMSPFELERKVLLERAVAIDPKFAEAYAESTLFDLNTAEDDPNLTREQLSEKLKKVEDYNRQALALDPDCVPALVHLSAFVRFSGPGKEKEADMLLDRALVVAPNDFRANLFAGFRIAGQPGRAGEAYAYGRRAHTVNPEFGRMLNFLYGLALHHRLTDVSDRWLKRMSELTRDLQVRELLAIRQLLDHQDFKSALDRLRLLPPTLEKERFSAADMTTEALQGQWEIAAKKLREKGDYAALLAQIDKAPDQGDSGFRDLSRAEILWRLGRLDEARQAASRVLESQEASIKKLKENNQDVRMGYFRLAKALEILGRQSEATAQIETFVNVRSIPEENLDLWVFRDNPSAMEQLKARLEKDQQIRELVAKRILEVERSYVDEPAGSAK